MTHDEMVAVIQAHKDGKIVQFRAIDFADEWCDVSEPSWDFSCLEYRIKPEPRKFYVGIDRAGYVKEARYQTDKAAEILRSAGLDVVPCIEIL